MLENIQLAAIVRKGSAFQLLRIPLHQTLQQQLAEGWSDQLERFTAGMQEIPFDPGYATEEHEQFCIEEYEPPEWLANKSSVTTANLDPISTDDEMLESIRGIVAFARNNIEEEVVLFQNFSRSHVIKPGRFLFLENNTYETPQHSVLTLDAKLSAAYFPQGKKLLFHSFRTTNTFLPLAQYYADASEQEIRDVLHHDLLKPENVDAFAKGSNQWFRKRFAMLADSGLLDEHTAEEIKERSAGYDVEIQIIDDKIVFPENKGAAKKMLQFLNEEIFRGAITETLYETNSKRQAD